MGRTLRNLLLSAAITGAACSPASAAWNKAESKHFVIYGEGRANDLQDFTQDLEKFDSLLRRNWRLPERDNQTKLKIYTVTSADEVARIMGQEGVAGFYSPSLAGSYAVSNRLHTSNRDNLSGQTTLFHEYAHHFMYRNLPIPAPSWFIEGFAEYVATAEFKKNGEWLFGKPAFHRVAEIEYADRIPVRDLLQVGGKSKKKVNLAAFYGWSWALTHMMYSEEEGRGSQLVDYLNAINRGEESLKAAEMAFGDLDQLDRKLRDYVKKTMAFSKSDKPIPYDDAMQITPLSDAQGRVVELAMQRRGRGTFDKALADLRAMGAAPDASADLLVELARAELDAADGKRGKKNKADGEDDDDGALEAVSGGPTGKAAQHVAALAAVDRALQIAPRNVEANILKSQLMLEALVDSGDLDSPAWDRAEQHALVANQADPHNPEALYAYTQVLQRKGGSREYLSPSLASAYSLAPEVRELRFAYAFDLANQSRFDDAIRLLQIVANDPHGGSSGRSAIETIERMRDGSTTLSVPITQIKNEDAE